MSQVMTPPRETGALAWAIDAFETDESLYRSPARFARRWFDRTGAPILPVSVFSARQFGVTMEFEYDSLLAIQEVARSRVTRLLRRLKLESVTAPPRVLTSTALSRAEEADELSRFAVSQGASAILIGTHGRRGVKRLLIGSFAEALLLRSQVPVLTINPLARNPETPRTILFPTEFGRYALRTFHRVLDLAEPFGARITLAHVLPGLGSQMLIASALGYPIPTPLFEDEIAQRRRAAQRHFESWIHAGQRRGIRVTALTAGPGDSIPAQILGLARKTRANLIALESESGWVSSAMLGSVCREIVREAACPVWVLRGARAFGQRLQAAA